MSVMNRELTFAPRPEKPFSYDLRIQPLRALQDGEVLVRNLLLSCDPTQMAWLGGGSSYAPPVRPGDVMRAWTAGHVIESRRPGFASGDRVWGTMGWQDYSISDGDGILPLAPVPADIPLSYPLSVTGINGVTAHLGVVDIGGVRAGETVVISTAAGATGSAAAQIARSCGARVIGIAGGKKKCEWLTRGLELAGAIDYKNEDVEARLDELCGGGVDFYFDNVGGPTLDTVLARMAANGRIALCGATSQYGGTPTPLRNGMAMLARTLTVRGMLLMNHLDRFAAISAELTEAARAGSLVAKEDVLHGLENAPGALLRLFEGKNLGKQLVVLEDAASLEPNLLAVA
jgi:NADPH-dependent curcumin reductase